MKKHSTIRARAFGFYFGSAMLGVLLAACSLPEAKPDLTRFYVLTSLARKSENTTTAPEHPPRVMLRSVIVPEYLRGQIIQVRVSENEVRFIDEARWAEPLEAGLDRVLRANLAAHEEAVQVVARGGEEHDYNVAVILRDCEGVLPSGTVRLAAHIEITSADLDPKVVAETDFTSEIPGWNGKDYSQLARKLSEAAAALSDRIVTLLPAKK